MRFARSVLFLLLQVLVTIPYAFLSMLGSWKDLACRRGVEKKISRKAGN